MRDNGINSDAAYYFASLRCHLSDFGEYLLALPLCAARPVTTPIAFSKFTETLYRAHMIRAGFCELASELSATARDIVSCRGMIERVQQRLEAHNTGWAVQRHGSKYLVLQDPWQDWRRDPWQHWMENPWRGWQSEHSATAREIVTCRGMIERAQQRLEAPNTGWAVERHGSKYLVLEDPWQDWRGDPWQHWMENPWRGWQSRP